MVLTGWNDQAGLLEELLVSHRRGGPYSYLYGLPLADPSWKHPEQLEFVCTADFLVLARVMRVNILVYWPAQEDMPARWVQFAGHHHGPAETQFTWRTRFFETRATLFLLEAYCLSRSLSQHHRENWLVISV